MKKTLIALALLIPGCAHRNDAADLNIYDVQWSKAGATREDWMRDDHDCKVEEHQRQTYAKIEAQNEWERAQEYNETMRRMGSLSAYSSGNYRGDKTAAQPFWQDCMQARSWKVTGQKPIGKVDDPEDLVPSTNSFKP